LFKLIAEAGFPAGAAQLLLGPGPMAGHALAANGHVDKVAFTGGTITGRKIMAAATGNIKKVTLELGGKSPCIVFADADFDVAIEFAMFAIFAGQGEVCSAGSRLILERKLADKFLPRLAEASSKIIVGDGLDPKTEMGRSTPHHGACWAISKPARRKARNCSAAAVASPRVLSPGAISSRRPFSKTRART
jgi:betaine-aldehyde dehydrogenase